MKRHPLERIVGQPWYLLGEPWAHGDYAGTMILAGNPDPHAGLAVCDTCDVLAEETDVETARAVAAHIVKLHNASLQAGEDAASQVEHLDVENHRLRRAMQKIMARLAYLLDEDQFGNVESIVTEAGVEPPEPGAQAPLLARIAELEAELEKTKAIFAASCNHAAVMEMDRDARRYRWLRARWGRVTDTYDGDSGRVVEIGTEPYGEGWDVDASSLDAAIDAAIKEQQQ